jgi:hypothetical protein
VEPWRHNAAVRQPCRLADRGFVIWVAVFGLVPEFDPLGEGEFA